MTLLQFFFWFWLKSLLMDLFVYVEITYCIDWITTVISLISEYLIANLDILLPRIPISTEILQKLIPRWNFSNPIFPYVLFPLSPNYVQEFFLLFCKEFWLSSIKCLIPQKVYFWVVPLMYANYTSWQTATALQKKIHIFNDSLAVLHVCVYVMTHSFPPSAPLPLYIHAFCIINCLAVMYLDIWHNSRAGGECKCWSLDYCWSILSFPSLLPLFPGDTGVNKIKQNENGQIIASYEHLHCAMPH